MMRERIVARLSARFVALRELVEGLDPELLGAKLDVPGNKSVADHIWCVIGARESYTRAIEAGRWQGFACSLTEVGEIDAHLTALDASATAFHQTLEAIFDFDDAREDLLLDLLEHEVMHEGQLIRHLKALAQPLPSSIKWA